MPTLITTSTYTKDEDFKGAAKVVPELGDPPKVLVTLKDLEGHRSTARGLDDCNSAATEKNR